MPKPRLFVGSSVENLATAYASQEELEHSIEVTVWPQGIFTPSTTTIASLLEALGQFDAALFVFAPDDEVRMRGASHNVARDNVIFEFGLFIGRLGLERVFLLVPRDTQMHLPTDLLGVTPLTYDPNRSDASLRRAVAPACNKIRTLLATKPSANRTPGPAASSLADDECVEVLRAWLDREIIDVLLRTTDASRLESQLGLPLGSVERLIERAIKASRRSLRVTVNRSGRLQLAESER